MFPLPLSLLIFQGHTMNMLYQLWSAYNMTVGWERNKLSSLSLLNLLQQHNSSLMMELVKSHTLTLELTKSDCVDDNH